jgi:hypothetical protein
MAFVLPGTTERVTLDVVARVQLDDLRCHYEVDFLSPPKRVREALRGHAPAARGEG